ncbi:MAG: GDSL family lipase [Clostridia bacterium]|nr:GDSL family lipase [Clostridia bacterium]
MKILEKIKKKQNDIQGSPAVTIAFLGDSVTQGCFELYKTGKESFQTEFRVEEGYHTKLRDLIQLLYPSVPINMIYAGISGNNAQQGLQRIERDVCAYKPDLTVVCFGLNDSCCGIERLKGYISDLKEIFKKLKSGGSEIIFMTPNLMADKVSDEITDEYTRDVYKNMIEKADNSLEAFIEKAKELCQKENIPVCDCYKTWKALKDNDVDVTRLLSNRINHPTEKMHWLFAIMLLKQIFKEEIL